MSKKMYKLFIVGFFVRQLEIFWMTLFLSLGTGLHCLHAL